jgi:hypothetical protein
MAVLDNSIAESIIKELYPTYEAPEELRKINPFYSTIQKMTDFGGKSLEVPLIIGSPQGGGSVFSEALAASNTAEAYQDMFTSFTLTRKKDYVVASIDGETIETTDQDDYAMVQVFQKTLDLAFHTALRRIARHMFRDGTGWLGKVSSIAGAVITLTNPSDAWNFDSGMRVSLYSSGASLMSAVRDGTEAAPIRVTAVDHEGGKITVSAAGTIAPDDYITAANDRTVSTSAATIFTNSRVITGVKQWIAGSQAGAFAANAPGAQLQASIYGVTRTSNVAALAGTAQDCTGLAPDEAIIRLATKVNAYGGRPDMCWMNPSDFSALVQFLGSRVIYDRVQSVESAEFGFQAVVLMGDTGPVKCVSDINVPKSEIFLLQMDTWDLCSAKGAPRILMRDDQRILRLASEDAYQYRVGGYLNMRCRAPNFNGRGFNYLAPTVN